MPHRRIRDYMTIAPHTIGAEQTLETAHRFMRSHAIRHLPVLRRGELIGVLSQGDLRLVETFKDTDPTTVTVEEAMSPDVFVVTPATLVSTAVGPMIEHKFGCVPVVQEGEVVGIFTTVDALRALRDTIESEREAELLGGSQDATPSRRKPARPARRAPARNA